MDDGRLWQGIIICVVISFLMGFFTACENALIEMNDSKAKRLIQEHKRGKTLGKLLSQPNRLVMSNLLAKSIMIIAISATATVYFFIPIKNHLQNALNLNTNEYVEYYGVSVLSFIIIVSILALVISIFCMILPKRLCSGGKISDKFILRSCTIYRFFLMLCTPLEVIASGVTTGILRLFGIKSLNKHESVTEEEILMMVDAVNETGAIEESQAEMISNIFEFDDLQVDEVMTHRTEVIGIEQNTPLREAIKIVIEEGFSRIPVYENNIDNICGVVYAKDMLKFAFEKNCDNMIIKECMREIKYIPESNSCDELFEYFSSQKNQIAVVVDEYGGTAGIVTMEDLLEAIVGNIQDEYDDEEEEIQEITPNTFDILGTADPDDAMEMMGKELPDEHDYDTMSGFVMDLLGYIPSIGETPSIKWENINFSIIKVSEKRIEKIRAVIEKENIIQDNQE